MRRALVLIIFVLAVSYSTRAQEANLPLITVTGEAEVKVVPDEVELSLGVETSHKSLQTSKSLNDERVKRVLDLVKTSGIDSKYVQTDFVEIEPWYPRGEDHPEYMEYRVRKAIVIILKDTGKFESLLSQVLDGGVNYVHGIRFRTTELRKYRDEARALAIKAAREKATALAAELGQRIGKAYRISEYGSGWYSPYGSWWGYGWNRGMTQNVVQSSGGNAPSPEGTIALGQISVTANVSVSFVLE